MRLSREHERSKAKMAREAEFERFQGERQGSSYKTSKESERSRRVQNSDGEISSSRSGQVLFYLVSIFFVSISNSYVKIN